MLKLHKNTEISENRNGWIAWLRNPLAKRWFDVLENPVNPAERCCLGHACWLFFSEGREVVNEQCIHDVKKYITYGSEKYELPREVQEKLDINSCGQFKESFKIDDRLITCCTGLNDYNYDISMYEIADIIEEQMLADNLYPSGEGSMDTT